MDIMESVKTNTKNLVLMVWVIGSLTAGSFTVAHRGSYWAGVGILLLALALPAIGLKLLQGASMLRDRFSRKTDDAVSPVIAVILMVAITVVLAATVWVWVSGFGTGTDAPGAISIVSGGTPTANNHTFVVTSATSVNWGDLTISVDGAEHNYANLTATPLSGAQWCVYSAGACRATATGAVMAGEMLYIRGASSGSTLRIIDDASNQVLTQVTLQ